MKLRLSTNSQAAATLMETIIATCIIAIASAGVIGCINYGMFVMQLARENQRATQIIMEKLESIRLYNWTQVTSGSGFIPTTFTDVYDPQGSTGQQGINYSGTIALGSPVFSGTAPSYSTNMKQFTVSVSWTTAGRVSHSRSVTTFVAKDGMQNYVY